LIKTEGGQTLIVKRTIQWGFI